MIRRIAQIISLTIGILSCFVITGHLYAEVNIAVIDSGSTGKFFQAVSFTGIAANTDPLSHGSKVASLIQEIAPEARIHILQVCEKLNGRYAPSIDGIIKAIQWCMENNIGIVNLSLVIPYDKRIEAIIKQAYLDKGIIFIAAVGNRNITSYFVVDNYGFVSLSDQNQELSFPASSDYVISVGAQDSKGSIADYSRRDADIFSQGSYAGLQGTSFACARITACAAKILAVNPNFSLEQLKQALK